MRAQRINEEHSCWVLYNNCLDVEFAVLVNMKLHQHIEAILVRGAPHYGFHQFECRVSTLRFSRY